MFSTLILRFLRIFICACVRLILLFLIWNYAIVPLTGWPIISMITMLHIYLAYNILTNTIVIEEEPIYIEDNDKEE